MKIKILLIIILAFLFVLAKEVSAQVSRSQFVNDVNAKIFPNNTRAITPAILNAILLESGNSYWNTITDGTPLLSTSGWKTTGNSGTTAGTNFVGTSDSIDFVTKTNGIERMRVLANGNVGIGTSSPTQKLSVDGNFNLSGRQNMSGCGKDIYWKRRTNAQDSVFVKFDAPLPCTNNDLELRANDSVPDYGRILLSTSGNQGLVRLETMSPLTVGCVIQAVDTVVTISSNTTLSGSFITMNGSDIEIEGDSASSGWHGLKYQVPGDVHLEDGSLVYKGYVDANYATKFQPYTAHSFTATETYMVSANTPMVVNTNTATIASATIDFSTLGTTDGQLFSFSTAGTITTMNFAGATIYDENDTSVPCSSCIGLNPYGAGHSATWMYSSSLTAWIRKS